MPRTAYGTTPGSYGLRQAAHELYPQPERDESIHLTFVPGADAFVLACDHFMWPGHSRVYRYLWKDGTRSGPLDVVGNFDNWAKPVYVGAATDSAQVTYVYSYNSTWYIRTEINGVLGDPQSVEAYLAARGYSGTALAFFVDAGGDLYMVVSGAKDGVAGFYYVQP